MRRRRRQPRRRPPAVPRSGEPRLRRLSDLVQLPRRSPLYPELARALAAASALHVLHSDLEPVPVRATSTTSQSGCYRLRDGDPVDLRVSRRHDRIALSFLHELGHFVDHQLGHELGATWASGQDGAFADWRTAVSRLPSRLPAGVGRSRRRYFTSSKELWARSYAQAVLTRSEDPTLQARTRRPDRTRRRLRLAGSGVRAGRGRDRRDLRAARASSRSAGRCRCLIRTPCPTGAGTSPGRRRGPSSPCRSSPRARAGPPSAAPSSSPFRSAASALISSAKSWPEYSSASSSTRCSRSTRSTVRRPSAPRAGGPRPRRRRDPGARRSRT